MRYVGQMGNVWRLVEAKSVQVDVALLIILNAVRCVQMAFYADLWKNVINLQLVVGRAIKP